MFSAVVHGIYAGDVSKLSINSTFKTLPDMEKRSGSLILDLLFASKAMVEENSSTSPQAKAFIDTVARSSIYSFKNGMQTLSDALEKKIVESGVEIIHDTCVDLDFKDKMQTIKLFNTNETIFSDHVFSGIPAPSLSCILNDEHQALKKELNQIKGVDVGVINLVYKNAKLPVDGFGFLVPKLGDLPVLGVVFDSCSFPPPNQDLTILTVMIGGHQFEKQFGNIDTVKEEALLKVASDAVEKSLGISSLCLVHSNVALQKQCIPQYHVGHQDRINKINSLKPSSLSLVGASYSGVAINDCIWNARVSAEKFIT